MLDVCINHGLIALLLERSPGCFGGLPPIRQSWTRSPRTYQQYHRSHRPQPCMACRRPQALERKLSPQPPWHSALVLHEICLVLLIVLELQVQGTTKFILLAVSLLQSVEPCSSFRLPPLQQRNHHGCPCGTRTQENVEMDQSDENKQTDVTHNNGHKESTAESNRTLYRFRTDQENQTKFHARYRNIHEHVRFSLHPITQNNATDRQKCQMGWNNKLDQHETRQRTSSFLMLRKWRKNSRQKPTHIKRTNGQTKHTLVKLKQHCPPDKKINFWDHDG